MLHKTSPVIAPQTFQLIQALQQIPELEQFYLVGGTALALQLGHRNSIDIDLFTTETFQTDILTEVIGQQFDLQVNALQRNSITGFINKIKVDFLRHNYPLIHPPITEENITFLSLEDIAAMKVNAIMNSGKRLKDFIDIYFLLEHFSLASIINFYAIKYPNFNPLIAIKAIGYFDDIDPDIDPPILFSPLPLESIKNRIYDAILHSQKKF